MIITVAFDVKNYIEVMEGWPIKSEDATFFLEREENVLKRVCLAFEGIGLEHAPKFSAANDKNDHAHMQINGGKYADLSRKMILNWQAVLSGIQIVDLDYDNYEIRYRAENIEEEDSIHVNSFKYNGDAKLNQYCDFEQVGRAFCAGEISDDRIESTSHFREGRIAFNAGRYVDAYNNMFLFLETRYCDGKTKTAQQVDILQKERILCESIERAAAQFGKLKGDFRGGNFDLFEPHFDTQEKIRTLVLLRGKLRHHSLKSPHRWDPNKQNEYEGAARFLSAVVGDVVIKESTDEIYAPDALDKFRNISVSTGYETKIKLTTHRLKKERTLALDMSFPTTVISSQLCLVAVRGAIEACEENGQLADTVMFEATQGRDDLELLSLRFDIWAYTETRAIEAKELLETVQCSFEHSRAGVIVKDSFNIPLQSNKITIPDVWRLIQRSFDHIEKSDPTTRVMNLKLLLKGKLVASYRVGSMVKN